VGDQRGIDRPDFKSWSVKIDEMDGKTVLITGATNGIGKAAALKLAEQGAHLVIVGRNPDRVAETVAALKAQTGNPNVDSIVADLSSMAEVRKVAAAFKVNHPRLDVLINNAGGVFTTRQETVDGYEMTFALNHLAYFLLTNLLLDTLKASTPARIINVASAAHTGGRINFDDLNATNGYQSSVYSDSKLANILFTYELARRLDGTGVTVNAVHPGFVSTGFGQNVSGMMAVLIRLARPFMLKPEQGADTIVYLASSPEVAEINGKYWTKRKPLASSNASYDVGTQARLWAVSEQMSGLLEMGV
jgi:NAD(P)-dependent dehydrogenase (short-subunit alcohol dehydrogenase family)